MLRFAFVLFFLSTSAFAVDKPITCTGNSCKVLLEPRTSTGAAAQVVAATAGGVSITGALGAGSAGQFQVATNGAVTATAGYMGNTDGSSPCAGCVGEFIQSRVTTFTNAPAATGLWGDITSISLTAGDWDVTGVVVLQPNGATVTDFDIGISSSSGNSATGLQAGDNQIETLPPTAAADVTLVIPSFRVNISSTTIYYLKANISYSIATPKDTARISARRVP